MNDVTINIRVSKAEKAHLTKIARLDGKSLSSMLREAALIQARRILAEFKITIAPAPARER